MKKRGKKIKVTTIKKRMRKKELPRSSRVGRKRLGVDLPTRLIEDIKKMALKHNQTITKYIGKRLYQIIEYEKSLEKDNQHSSTL